MPCRRIKQILPHIVGFLVSLLVNGAVSAAAISSTGDLWMNLFLDAVQTPVLGTPAWMWLAFLGIVALLLVLDLGVLHKHDRQIGVRESLALSMGYVSIALLFGAGVWWAMGETNGMAYFTGFLVEKSLSMDNVFVIALIFTHLDIPRQYQHRVLFWGILGAILLRAIMIGVGAALVSKFSWILYLFGAFLIFTGVRMWITADRLPNVANNALLLQFLGTRLRVGSEVKGKAFFVRLTDPMTAKTALWTTPLFLALCLVEFVDLLFAVDSVPAIFAITRDPFIVYTSNVFAILGLRALYFALSAVIGRFRYLKFALALVLVFIGVKTAMEGIIGKIPSIVSLCVTFAIIAGGVIASLWRTRSAPLAWCER